MQTPWRRQKKFPVRVAELRAKLAPGTPIEVWCQNEMRVGQKNELLVPYPDSAPNSLHDPVSAQITLFGRLYLREFSSCGSCGKHRIFRQGHLRFIFGNLFP
jgi:hypothetical protein